MLRISLCLLLTIAFASFAIANTKTDDSAKDAYSGQTEQELVFVSALNEYRATRGLHPVTVSGELSQDCRGWSTRMRQRGQISHDPNRGDGMEICAQITQESGINALQAWQRSPAHNAILLSSRMDTIGIGSDDIWWTMRGKQMNAERTVNAVRTEIRTTDIKAKTEITVEMADEIPGFRVPMGVAKYSAQRQPSTASYRYR